MRKSRLLALFLTVVFILANVAIPSFAAAEFVYGDPADYIAKGTYVAAPLPGGAPLHIAYTLNEEGVTYTNKTSQKGLIGTEKFVIGSDGILNILPQWDWPYWPQNEAGTQPTLNASVYQYMETVTAGGTVSRWNDTHSITSVLVPYSFNVEDGITPQIKTDTFYPFGMQYGTNRTIVKSKYGGALEVTSDASGNHYMVSQAGKGAGKYIYPQAAFGLTAANQPALPFVFSMDLLDLSTNIPFPLARYMIGMAKGYKLDTAWRDVAVSSGATVGPNFDFTGFSAVGWHNYKWIITPNTYTTATGVTYDASFDLFIDDELVLKNVKVDTFTVASNSTAYEFTTNGIDNLTRYGTSLGFAHDVNISSTDTKPGAVITASALKADMPGNIPETLEVAIFRADSLDGTYEKVSDGASYVATSADDSKFFKAAARVVDFDGCATEWLFSDDVVTISEPLAFTGDPESVLNLGGHLVAPIDGVPLHISYKVNKPATYSLDKAAEGITISDDGILSMTSAASIFDVSGQSKAPGVTASAVTDFGTLKGSKIATVYGSYNFTFDDGVNPKDSNGSGNGRVVGAGLTITSDASGRIYGKRTGSGGYSTFNAQSTFLSRSAASAPFVFEMDIQNMSNWINLYYTSNPTYKSALVGIESNYTIDTDWIDFAVSSGATFNSDFDTKNFSAWGWHNYKWVITPNAKVVDDKIEYAHYDLYIDDVNILKNVPVYFSGTNGSMQTGNSSNYALYVYCDGIDNIQRYGTSLGFAHDVAFSGDAVVGSTLTAKAKLAHGPYYNIPESLEKAFFVADSANGEYTLLATGDSYVVGAEAAGKYIKSAARVKEDLANGAASEWVLSAKAEFIPDSNISSIALKVDGADADINAVNLAGKTEAQIDITITAASADGKDAKFVLAQYATVSGKKVLVGAALNDADLTEDANSFDLSLKAANIDANTSFRLFILTANGLVPVKDIEIK